jgi:hypothetical protein
MNTDSQNGHLSANDIAQWLVEGPSAEAETHVLACRGCEEKLAEAREPLAIFRSAVVAWSEGQPAARISVGEEKNGWRRWTLVDWMPVASVAFAVLVLAVFLLRGGSLMRRDAAPELTAKTPTVSDTVLMEQVDAEVSETVPDAMAPLTDLVGWDSGATATTDGAAKHGVKKKTATVSHSKAHGRGND